MKHLTKWLRERRKEANVIYGRNDAYGRGLKSGLDMAMEAAQEFEKGSIYDPFLSAWLTPKTDKQ